MPRTVASYMLTIDAVAALALKRAHIDASRATAHERRIKPRQRRDTRRDAFDSGAVALAAQKVLQIVASRVALDLAECLAVEGRFLFADRRCHRRQPRDPAKRGVASAAPAEIERCRHQHKPADPNALVVELARKPRRADAAVALAGNEFLRRLASVLLDPLAHEGRKHVDVAIDRPELLAHLVARVDEAAVACTDGIDEHEVGEIEPGFGIGDDGRRRRRRDAIERQPPRTHRAKMQIGR